jgi:hypothetical protein
MAEQISFSQFKQMLETPVVRWDVIAEYVEFDPTSPIPKLRIKANTLIDTVPAGYDVDDWLCIKLREEGDKAADLRDLAGKIQIVAEGDSWFRMPSGWPTTIAQHLEHDNRFNVRNIACWGHTLSKMLKDKEYLKKLDKHSEVFLLSAGGNDFQETILAQRRSEWVNDRESSSPTPQPA